MMTLNDEVIYIGIAASLALIVLLFFIIKALRIHKDQSKPNRNSESIPSQQTAKHYHSVSIAPGIKACSAVMEIKNKRFLASEAVPFPLPDCNIQDCQCRYIHHDDRRKAEDRRHEFIEMENAVVNDQRSKRRDRRLK